MQLSYDKLLIQFKKWLGRDGKKHFVTSVFLVGLGSVFSTIIVFIINVLGGRILGPYEFGKFTLIYSISMLIYHPMSLGITTAVVKYNSEKKGLNRNKNIISTGFIIFILLSIITLSIYIIFSTFFSKIFNVTKSMFILASLFAFIYVLYMFCTNIVRSFHKMKQLSILYFINGLIMIFTFIILLCVNIISYKTILIANITSFSIISAIIIVKNKKYIMIILKKEWVKRIFSYGLLATVGGISFTLYTNIDKIFIARYMSISDVAFYRAYYISSINVTFALFNIFNIVYFPYITKFKKKRNIFLKIRRIFPVLLCFIPIIMLFEFLILKLFGSEYTIDMILLSQFAIVSVLSVFYGLLDWTFCSIGIKGLKDVNKVAIIIAIVNIILNYFLIPIIGLSGAIGATGLSFLVGIVILIKLSKKY